MASPAVPDMEASSSSEEAFMKQLNDLGGTLARLGLHKTFPDCAESASILDAVHHERFSSEPSDADISLLEQEAHLPSAAWLFDIKCREAKRPDPLVPLDVAQTIELGASLNWVCCAYFHGSKTGAAPSWRGWQKTGHPDSVPLIMQMVRFATERTP